MSHFFKVGDKVRTNPVYFSEPRNGIVVAEERIRGHLFPTGVKWDNETEKEPYNFYKDAELLPNGACPCCDNRGTSEETFLPVGQSKRSNPRISPAIAKTVKKDALPEPVSSEEAFLRTIIKSLNNETLELRNELRDTAKKLGETQDEYWNLCEKHNRLRDEFVPIRDENRTLSVENSKLRRLVETLERVKGKK